MRGQLWCQLKVRPCHLTVRVAHLWGRWIQRP
uniref:Uncharacterized protein n=1 Tax=Anguilla anguilla TaxID=7936 RepID=A0A0E9QVM8_ANGAN